MHTLIRSLILILAIGVAAPAFAAADMTIGLIADAFSNKPAPALAALMALSPDEVWGIGDLPHDNPATNCTTDFGCQAKMEAMYQRLYGGGTRLGVDFKREIIDSGIPFRRINDDHDTVRDNASNDFPFWPSVLAAFLTYHTPAADNGFAQGYMYQSFVVNDDTLVVFLDLRSHRETQTGLFHTILGAEQTAWLNARLTAASQTPAIRRLLVVSTVPVNPGQKKLDSWSGFKANRTWFYARLAQTGLPTIILSADCHWGSIALSPDVELPELNVPHLQPAFANTCNNKAIAGYQGWTHNSLGAIPGFGLVTLRAHDVVLAIYNVDGTVRFRTTVATP